MKKLRDIIILFLSIYPIVSIMLFCILSISNFIALSNDLVPEKQFIEYIIISFLPVYLNILIIPFNLIFYIIQLINMKLENKEKITLIILIIIFNILSFPIMYFYLKQKTIGRANHL